MNYKNLEEYFEPTTKVDGEETLADMLQRYQEAALEQENRYVEFIRFNQSMEGFEMTPEGEARCRRIFRGEISADEAVKEILKSHGIERE